MLWRSHGLGAGGTGTGVRAAPAMLDACFSGLDTISLRTESSSSTGDLGDISLGGPCLWYMEPHSPWEMDGFETPV